MNFQVNGDTSEAMMVWRRHQYTKALAPLLIAVWLLAIVLLYHEHEREGSKHIENILNRYSCTKIKDNDVIEWSPDCASLDMTKQYYHVKHKYRTYKITVDCDEDDLDFKYRQSMFSTYEGEEVLTTFTEFLVPLVIVLYFWEVLYLSLYDLLCIQVTPTCSGGTLCIADYVFRVKMPYFRGTTLLESHRYGANVHIRDLLGLKTTIASQAWEYSSHGVRLPLMYLPGALVFMGILIYSAIVASLNQSINECTLFDDGVPISLTLLVYIIVASCFVLVFVLMSINQWYKLWSVVNLQILTEHHKYYFEARMRYRRHYLFSTRSIFHWIAVISCIPIFLFLVIYSALWAILQVWRCIRGEAVDAFEFSERVLPCFERVIKRIDKTDHLYEDMKPLNRLKTHSNWNAGDAVAIANMITACKADLAITVEVLQQLSDADKQALFNNLDAFLKNDPDAESVLPALQAAGVIPNPNPIFLP